VPSGSAVFLRLLIGELGTPRLVYGKWLYPYRILLHGPSDLDQRCLKTRNSKDFPTKYLRPYPLKSPKTPFWGPVSANSTIERALRKSHVNGATKLKRYSYIGIGK